MPALSIDPSSVPTAWCSSRTPPPDSPSPQLLGCRSGFLRMPESRRSTELIRLRRGMLKVGQLDHVRGRRFLLRLRPSFEVRHKGARPWTSRRLRKIRGGYGWHWGGAIGRFRDVFRVLSRTAQAGGIRRPVFLLGLGILVWLFKDHFLFGAHNLLATDLHGLHTHRLVGHDTDKVHNLRRIAIDPFFIFGFAISLAHFFRRLALGVQH